MNRRPHRRCRWAWSCLAVLTLALPACDDDDNDTQVAWIAQDGKVIVVIRDAPALELEHVFLEITRVSLLPPGDGAPVVVFEGQERLDLLRHREKGFLLASGAGAPVGRYDGVRLEFSTVEVGPASACPEVNAPSGRIDLDPGRPIEVEREAPLLLELDLDAGKSLSVQRTGQGKRCLFRPVVFVEARTGAAGACRQEVAGEILRLEPLRRSGDGPSLRSGHGEVLAELVLDLGRGRGSVELDVEASTRIYDARANLAGLSTLRAGERASGGGKLERGGDIRGVWLMGGDAFVAEGVLAETVPGSFRLRIAEGGIAEGQPVEGRSGEAEVRCLTTPGTLILETCEGEPLPAEALAEGRSARIHGALLGAAEARVAVVELGPREARGTISVLDWSRGRGSVLTAGGEELEFQSDESTQVALVGHGRLTAGDLRAGQLATVSLETGGGRALHVEVEPEVASGAVELFDLSSRSFLLTEAAVGDGSTPAEEVAVTVAQGATIILLEGDSGRQVDLALLEDGDQATASGLLLAAGALEAHALVIHRAHRPGDIGSRSPDGKRPGE